ncbi:hypothetical protein [Burkholderia sp. Ac-20365]|uniref:hypothetical protein n=1 Tax=Burkholderia sp. Ac-20365 TaxID=2703897 RepID=UPI00197C6C21|nr:hypothetical protein [Burkholderia sp. Ac-20365]MBN3760884.1 hypothetical protein [Burkholderia sp. Ac-20365]
MNETGAAMRNGNTAKPSLLITVFARREHTNDAVLLQHHPQTRKQDIVIYRNRECTDLMARIPWHSSNRPRKSSRRITLNCWRWKLEWANAAPSTTVALAS